MVMVFAFDGKVIRPSDLPELEEFNQVIENNKTIDGLVFTIFDYDESALASILPRILYYTAEIRKKYPNLPIAAVSHGDEMLSLTRDNINIYPEIHKNLKILVYHFDVSFHICGAFADLNDLEIQDFPDYVDVVPFGPTQIADYLSLGFQHIELEESL